MDGFTFWSWIVVIGMIYRMAHCQSQLTILSFFEKGKKTFFFDKSDNINNFVDAVAKCKRLGGSLASVHTRDRELIVYDLIRRGRCNRKY